MIKIIVDNDDGFYRLGIQTLLNKLFSDQFDKSIFLTSGINKNNVAKADIIIMGISPGERFVCHPMLYARKRNSLIIGVYSGSHESNFDELPLCFENITFIPRTETLIQVVKKIVDGWERCCEKTSVTGSWSCQDCRHKTLSPQQIKVATHYYHGANAEQIAQILKISPKTVFTHKRMIMGKFNINSDFELLSLLNVMKTLKIMPQIFL